LVLSWFSRDHKLKPYTEDIWDWTVGAIDQLGEAIVEVVETVVQFVNDTYHKVVDWIKSQFDKIWEGFIRDTANLLQRGSAYLDRAGEMFDIFSQSYQVARPDLHSGITDFLEGPVVTTFTDPLEKLSETIDEYIPPLDKDLLKSQINTVMGPIQEALEGTIIEVAYELLSGKALEILSNVFKDHMGKIFNNTLGPYINMFVDILTDLFSDLAVAIPLLAPMSSTEDEDLIDMFLNMVDLLSNPASLIVNLIDTFDADFILGILDNFLIDNPQYMVSIYDLVKTMIKPTLVLGVVFFDLISLAGDVFSPNLLIQDVKSLNIMKFGASSQIDFSAVRGFNTDSDALKVAKRVSGIFSFVGQALALISSEINKWIDVIDLQDGGRAAIRTLILGFFDTVWFLLIDLNGLVITIWEAIEHNWTAKDITTLAVNIPLMVVKAIEFIAVMIASIAVFGNPVGEAIVTILDIIFKVLVGVVEIGLNLAMLIVFTILYPDFSVKGSLEFGGAILGLISNVVSLIYDTLATALAHGTHLLKIPAPPALGPILYAIYLTFAQGAVLLSLASLIFDFVIFVLDWSGVFGTL